VKDRNVDLEEAVERVAKSESAHLLIDGEQGPWPGTKAWEREVRENAREIILAAFPDLEEK